MYNSSNALLTVNGVVGTPTIQNNGIDYADVFGFDAIAGTTYAFNVSVIGEGMNALEESGAIFDVNDVNVGSIPVSFNGGFGEFTAPTDGRFYLVVGDANAYLSQFTITMSVVESIESMINAAFVSAKTYIDAKDSSLKAYTDAALNSLMQTSDLTAKLAVLAEINTILDGDAATAGFQAWQSSLNRLTAIELDVEAKHQYMGGWLIANVNSLNNDIQRSNSNIQLVSNTTFELENKITTETKRIDDASIAAFKAMKDKAAILFAV